MSTNQPARIFFLLAREVNKAVVFRRGPTKWTQMIVWDLNSDELEYGQWSKVKFQKWRCDLSPSGKHLIYLDDQFENGDSATVVSKPPFWAAIAKWKHYNPLFGIGGGVFRSENEVTLNWHYMLEADELFPVPPQLKVICKGESFNVETTRLKRDGWSLLDAKQFINNRIKYLSKPSIFWDDIYKFWEDSVRGNKFQSTPKLWSKPVTKSSSLYRLSYYHYEKYKRLSKFFIKRRQEVNELEQVEWAEVDCNGRIIASKNGTLIASKTFNDGSVQLGNLELLHDLNPQKPEEIPVPDIMKRW
ncbi:hypothetical protein [Flavivirga eckloniae]|uniref:Uncharacterized protein n=1 Tax=Flavivirga eckloniae TaxID=1803846 RepID=A0A2K9PQC4_9FLAO|nr:hypothetical protein [Flavivirga eckloniae]AUP79254.1 hypothetical protein C1H87_11285 [Flavivirga eckloniae]